MSQKRQNIIVLAVVFGFLVFLTFTAQEPEEWIPTWHSEDEEPYGGFVTHQLVEDLFPGQPVRSEFRSLYELAELEETENSLGNLLLVSNTISLDENDSETLFTYLKQGNQALIAAHYFKGEMMDSLGVETSYEALEDAKDALPGRKTVELQFRIPGFPKKVYDVEMEAAAFHFSDTARAEHSTLAVNAEGEAVLRSYPVGEGRLYLSSNPLLLTNYFVLDSASSGYGAGLLSLLPPDAPLTHVEYYHLGRMESQTPLRYLLSQPELRFAVYVSLIGLLLFMVFEAKRKQRIIPIVKPPKNTSIEFAETLGQLHYHSRGDHLAMAEKRANYLLEYIRIHYYLPTSELDYRFVEELAQRSQKPLEETEKLIGYVRLVRRGKISEKEFLEMEEELSRFYDSVEGLSGTD